MSDFVENGFKLFAFKRMLEPSDKLSMEKTDPKAMEFQWILLNLNGTFKAEKKF